jgi:hypothetical protein
MPLNGYLSTLPSDLLLLPAIIRIGSTNIGVTRGGAKWDPGHEFENVDFDGKQGDIYLLDRKFHGVPKFSATLLEYGDATTGNQIAKLEPGSTSASAGSPNVTTITPAPGGAFLASGDYQSAVRMCWDRGVGSGTKRYTCILFDKALFARYSIAGEGGSRKEATIDMEIHAKLDASSNALGVASYKIELREALP